MIAQFPIVWKKFRPYLSLSHRENDLEAYLRLDSCACESVVLIVETEAPPLLPDYRQKPRFRRQSSSLPVTR